MRKSFFLVGICTVIVLMLAVIVSQKMLSTTTTVSTRASEQHMSLAMQPTSARLAECNSLSSTQRIACLSEKTKMPPSKWSTFKKWRLIYNGKEINTSKAITPSVLGETNPTLFNRNLNVGPLFISEDLSDTYVQDIKNAIETVWAHEPINKKVVLNDPTIHRFDSTKITNCFFDENWTNVRIYFPNLYCQSFSDGYPIGIQRIGYGGQNRFSTYIYVDGDFVTGDINKVLKHELGHSLGAIDADYVEVAPNTLFPSGNSRTVSDPMFDIMYDTWKSDAVSDFTLHSINSTKVNQYFDIFSNWQENITLVSDGLSKANLSGSTYKIYGGIMTINHQKGVITEEPLCEGVLDSTLNINLKQNCKDLLTGSNGYMYIAGFIHIQKGSTELTGKFDFIDMIMSKVKKEQYINISVNPRIAPTPVSETRNIPKSLEIMGIMNQSTAYSFTGLNITARDSMYLRLKSWHLCASPEIPPGECYTLASDEKHHDPSQSLALTFPPQLHKYEGWVTLFLSGTYTSPWLEVPYVVQRKILIYLVDKPYIYGANFMGNTLIIEGTSFTHRTNPPSVFIDGTNILSLPGTTVTHLSDTRIAANLKDNHGAKSHKVVVMRDDILSNEYQYNPSVQTDIFTMNDRLKRFTLDPTETAIIHFEFECKKDMVNVLTGFDTLDNAFSSSFKTTHTVCKSGEHKIVNYKVPASDIFKNIINNPNNGDKKGYVYVCAIENDSENVHFDKQSPVIITLFNLHNKNKVFYNCISDDTTFAKR